MSVDEGRVNVLMVSMALQGHINPMLKFAKHLISKGVHVTIATTENCRHHMLKNIANTNNLKYSDNSDIELEFFSDGLSLEFDRFDTESLVNSTREKGSRNFSALLKGLTKARDYACVVVNPFVPWAIDVAVGHRIPCALLWIQASAAYSIYYHYSKNTNLFPDLEDPNEKVHLPGLPPFKVKDIPSFILPSTPYHFREIIRELFNALDKVNWVLGASFHKIEEEIVNSMALLTPIYPIGPLVSPFLLGENEKNDVSVDMWNAEDSCLEWLDNKPKSSVIYVSFGSLLVLSQKQVDNIATALKNSKKSFLWVVKPKESSNTDDDVGVKLPNEFLEETKEIGLVVKWCPQEKVLMHPSVSCFISHCGWNSTLETVVSGVPVIAWPFWTDQPTNAMLIENVFRNGVRVKCGEKGGIATVEEIERCIRDVLEGENGEEIKQRALKIKDLAKKALLEGGTSNKNINRFINDLKIAGNASTRA